MTDLSLRLQQAHSQLPVSAYLDHALYTHELETLFRRSPRYLGHRLSVPEIGDFYTLPQENHGRVLIHTPDAVELLSNICRHRQALLLKDSGNLFGPNSGGGGNIVCPLHRWTYSQHGQLLGAPHFQQDPCLDLNRYPIRDWNGLLFEDNGRDIAGDLAPLGTMTGLNFSGYRFHRAELHMCHYNWKTFIEVYLEDYHVGPFHPGLNQFVNCADLQWEFNTEYSIQTVGVANQLKQSGSPAFRHWQELLLQYRQGMVPTQGAIWLTYYPHLMVEWYPEALMVSSLHPIGPQQTLNVVEFFYPEEVHAFEPELIAAQQAAYMETCIEDDEIAERMDAGRKALFQRGENDAGPYQSPMEDGMQHFHEWYKSRIQL